MSSANLLHGELTSAIIGAFFNAYNKLGYGFLEHVYIRALEIELRRAGHTVARELVVPVFYDEMEIATQRLDMVVDGVVVVEVKSTTALPPSSTRQVFSYLRATRLDVGLVLHFAPEKAVFKRVICDASHKRIRPVASVEPAEPARPSS